MDHPNQLAQDVVGAGLRLLDPGDVLRAGDHDVVGEAARRRSARRRSRPARSWSDRGGAPRRAPRSRSPEPPLVESASSTSPGRPWAITCRAKIASTPTSLAIAVRIAGSAVRSIAGRPRVAAGRPRRPWRRSPSRRCRARARARRRARACRRGEQRLATLGQRLRSQLADLLGLHQDRAPHVLEHRVVVGLLLAEERVEEAGRAGVVHAALAVVEEHVHELPQHVVRGLDQLLADERIVLRAGRARCSSAGVSPDRSAERDHHVVGLGEQLELLGR